MHMTPHTSTRGRGTQAVRQLELLRRLVRTPEVPLPQLQDELGFHWRTLRRDLEQLAEAGAPVACEQNTAVATSGPLTLARWLLGQRALAAVRRSTSRR
jgi:hypothetical protein